MSRPIAWSAFRSAARGGGGAFVGCLAPHLLHCRRCEQRDATVRAHWVAVRARWLSTARGGEEAVVCAWKISFRAEAQVAQARYVESSRPVPIVTAGAAPVADARIDARRGRPARARAAAFAFASAKASWQRVSSISPTFASFASSLLACVLVPSSGVATGTRWFPHLAPIAFKSPCPKHRTQQQERASAGGSDGGRTTVPSCAYALSLFVSPIQITAAAAMPIARVSSGHGHPTATQRCDGPSGSLDFLSDEALWSGQQR